MDRFEAMSVLLAAIDAGSLSAAARRLRMPLPTVSRKVAALEAELGAQLLIRSSRRVSLTDAGRAYVASARRILEQLDEAERTAAGEFSSPRGSLTVSAPIVFGRVHVLPVALEFLESHPDIDLRLLLLDRMVNLVEEHVDLAVRIGHLDDSALIAKRVGSVRRVVCASPAYLAQHGEPATPKDLSAHACITFEGVNASGAWQHGDETVTIRSRLSVNTAEAAVDAAIAGLGVTRVLSYQADAAVRAGCLRIVLEDHEPEPWPVSLVHPDPHHGLLPIKVRAFVDWAAPRLTARRSSSGD